MPTVNPFQNARLYKISTHSLRTMEKFRNWTITFINAMDQVDPKYGAALMSLMKWADAEAVPDMESGWPGNQILREAGLTEGTGDRPSDQNTLNGNQL